MIVSTTLAAVSSASAGAAAPSATTVPAGPTVPAVPSTARPAPTTTLPQVTIENNRRGVIPPDDPNCQY